jgi:hypothetical protein
MQVTIKFRTGLMIPSVNFSNAMKSFQLLENYHEICELEEIMAHHIIF